MPKVEIFTDGACKGNPGPGGWGCILIQDGTTRELKGYHPNTTNNIMELTAAIMALNELTEPFEVELSTDSQYMVKGITEWMPGWLRKNWVNSQKKPVKNKELWQELLRLDERHRIDWIWVRGHAGHTQNERADWLANEAITQQTG